MWDRVLFNLLTLISSPILGSVLSAWLLSQFIKSVIFLFKSRMKGRELAEAILWTTGGMPSSHSATVCALSVSVALRTGLSSPLFMICATFSFITIRDALGVRHSAGEQAKRLNHISRELKEKFGWQDFPVKEIKGHEPAEVFVGCLIGIVLAFIFYYYVG